MKEFFQISLAEIISISGGILAGSILASYFHYFELIPGLIVFIPGFLAMMGSISGSLSARLSSALHIGSLKPKIEKQGILIENILASLVLAMIAGFTLGSISTVINYFIFKVFSFQIIKISLIATLISIFIQTVLVVYSEFFLFKHKLDPDNIMGPYITTIGDVVCVASLLIAVVIC